MQYRWLILMLCALPSIQTANAAPYDYDETTQTLTIEFKGTSATNIFQTSSAPVNHSEGVCTAEGECSPGVSQIYIAQGGTRFVCSIYEGQSEATCRISTQVTTANGFFYTDIQGQNAFYLYELVKKLAAPQSSQLDLVPNRVILACAAPEFCNLIFPAQQR